VGSAGPKPRLILSSCFAGTSSNVLLAAQLQWGLDSHVVLQTINGMTSFIPTFDWHLDRSAARGLGLPRWVTLLPKKPPGEAFAVCLGSRRYQEAWSCGQAVRGVAGWQEIRGFRADAANKPVLLPDFYRRAFRQDRMRVHECAFVIATLDIAGRGEVIVLIEDT
jgi:hypothetical protein